MLHVFRAHHLSHDREAALRPRQCQKAQALFPQPLERVWAGPRLKSPPSQKIGPGRLHCKRRLDNLLFPFHRTGTGGNYRTVSFSDFNATDVDDAARGVKGP